MRICSMQFSLDGASLSCFRANLDCLLKRQGIADEQRADAALVLTEYLTNLLKHANAKDHLIQFEIVKTNNTLVLSLDDRTLFNGALEQQARPTERRAQPLKENGMGLGLIRELVPEYHYQRSAGINHFEFDVALP